MKYETLSASELGSLVRSGQVDPVDVITYFLDRIKRGNPKLNAFVYVKEDEALEAAKQLKQRIAAGEDVGPFAGVPFALKDFLPSKKGWMSDFGGVASLAHLDEEDSEFCKAMEKAGGIALGKTNAPAFGFRGTTDNCLYGPTHNAFDASKNAGGSSGGSASAVAGGLILMSEGGDAGGSIRIPAAWNNLFGFKASAGVIPNYCRPDGWAASHPFCCNGGLTKTVEDAAILLSLMARYEPRDPYSRKILDTDYVAQMKQSLKGKRVAFTPDFGVFPVEPEIAEACRKAAFLLKQEGIEVEEIAIRLPRSAKELGEVWSTWISFDTAIELEQWKEQGLDLVKDHRDELPAAFIEYNEKASRITAKDLYGFNLVRTELLDAFESVFEKYDAILSPIAGCLAVDNADDYDTQGPREIDGKEVDSLIGFTQTFPVNFIGYPAASVPAGLSKTKLPIGLQIIAPKLEDGLVLALGHAFEKVAPWRDYYDLSYCD